MRGHAALLGARIPGSSPVHASPLLLKYGGVLASGLAVVLHREAATALVLLAVSVVLYAVAGRAVLRTWMGPLKSLWWLFAILAAHQWWLNGAWSAMAIVGCVVACLQFARLLLLTTPQSELIDGLAEAVAPLRRVGVDPDAFALAVSLMLRSIPAVMGAVQNVSDAARARGLGRNPLALASPVVVSTVAYAQQTGDALAARGVLDASGEAVPETRARG